MGANANEKVAFAQWLLSVSRRCCAWVSIVCQVLVHAGFRLNVER